MNKVKRTIVPNETLLLIETDLPLKEIFSKMQYSFSNRAFSKSLDILNLQTSSKAFWMSMKIMKKIFIYLFIFLIKKDFVKRRVPH